MKIIPVTWTELKQISADREASIQYYSKDGKYIIFVVDDVLFFETEIESDLSTPSADQVDFETNYQPTSNLRLEDRDSAGRKIVRSAATRKGWHYQTHSVSFEVGIKDSLYNKTDQGVDLGYAAINFYSDIAGTLDITLENQAYITSNAKKTVVKWSPDFDFEIISGSIRQVSTYSTDMYMYVNAQVQTGLAAPYNILKVPFVQGGLNLRYIGADEPLKTDGRASKFFNGAAGDYFELIVNHELLANHKITVIFEIYKNPLG